MRRFLMKAAASLERRGRDLGGLLFTAVLIILCTSLNKKISAQLLEVFDVLLLESAAGGEPFGPGAMPPFHLFG